MAYLRSGEELGFGGLADPEPWLERLEMPGAVLAPRDCLDAASLIDCGVAARTLSRDLGEIPAAHRARPFAGGFALSGRPPSAGPFFPTAKSATMPRRHCAAFARE